MPPPALVLGLILMAGCQSHPGRIDAWPFYYHEEIGDHKTTEIMWPIGGGTKDPKAKESGAWPFYTKRTEEERNETSTHAFYPLYNRRTDPAYEKTWVLPFYLGTKSFTADGRPDIDHTFFPLVFIGTSPPEQRYFAFFPFYGTLKDRLARDEIFFVMFPLYSRSKLHGHTANNMLFPLIAWTYGGGRTSSRVLPFYTYFHKEGEPELWSVLWPIVHFSRSTGEEQIPRSLFYIFPLFGWDNSEREHKWTILWPFFSYGRRPGTDYYNWTGPWPILRLQKDREISRTQIWPFYGHVYNRGGTTRWYMWPVYRDYYKETERIVKREWSILFLLQNRIFEDKKDGTTEVRRLGWPLFRYFRRPDGSKKFHALSPLPYWNERGFERNYSRFWRIVEYVKDAERDESSFRFIWRVVRYDRYKQYKTFNVLGPLFRYEREPEVQTKFSILSGLLSVGSRGGAPVFKLFYIPFAGGKDVAPAAEAN